MTMKKLSRLLALSLLLLASLAQAGDTVTYFVPDHTGSPVAAMDAQGNVLWREAHGPWGERLLRDARNTATPSYTGKPEDRDTGLVYMGARWYDPAAGRFTGIDPVGFGADNVQTFNRYAYANNSPYVYLDPNGETPIDVFTSLMPAAGRSLAGITAYGVGMATGNHALVNAATDGMRAGRMEGLTAIASIFSPVPGAKAAINAARAQRTDKVPEPAAGQKIFRVYGGDSAADGASWSPIDPSLPKNFRAAAGLPSGGTSGANNSGRFVIEGTLMDPSKVVLSRKALPLDGQGGGLPEYVIPKWVGNGAVRVDRVSGVNPEF